VRDLLAERQLDVSARTVLAWAHKFGPLLAAEGRRHARPVGSRWWTDETYVRVGGRWAYLHASYRRAVRRRAWRARHIRTGLHRARGETTKAIERSHVPIKDRLRPMRGLHSIASGQRLLEGIELAQAIRRGHVRASNGQGSAGRYLSLHERAREAADTFIRLARALAGAA
jgi:transposase-like protein